MPPCLRLVLGSHHDAPAGFTGYCTAAAIMTGGGGPEGTAYDTIVPSAVLLNICKRRNLDRASWQNPSAAAAHTISLQEVMQAFPVRYPPWPHFHFRTVTETSRSPSSASDSSSSAKLAATLTLAGSPRPCLLLQNDRRLQGDRVVNNFL